MSLPQHNIGDHDLKYKGNENDNFPLRILSSAIFQGNEQIIIEHNGKEYILRITRSDKLLLTK